MAAGAASRWHDAAKLVQHCCTQQPGTAAVGRDAQKLLEQLSQQPAPPKAAWKKLVQQLNVPLQLGTTFSTAAKYSWRSKATQLALHALQVLLEKAAAADLIKGGAAASSLASSMQQQLQQAGVLQQLAAVMTALADALQAEAAAVAAGGWDTTYGSVEHFTSTSNDTLSIYFRVVYVAPNLRSLWCASEQSSLSTQLAWLCDPSGHAAATLQLCSAAQRYVGGLLRHALPTVREREPQQVVRLLQILQVCTCNASVLSRSILKVISEGVRLQKGQNPQAGALQQLVLLPQVLPCAVASVLMSSCSMRLALLADSSSSSRSSRAASDAPSACHLQLLELLGLHLLMMAWGQLSDERANAAATLASAAEACTDCCNAAMQQLQAAAAVKIPEQRWHQQQQQHMQEGKQEQQQAEQAPRPQQPPGEQREQAQGQEQQRWQFEQQVWVLLPTALLPCAGTLQSRCAQQQEDPEQQLDDLKALWWLLQVCKLAWLVLQHLHLQWGSLGISSTPAPPAVVQELLDAVLQLTRQQHLAQTPAAAAALVAPLPGPAASAQVSSSTHSGSTSSTSDKAGELCAMCHGSLLVLLAQALWASFHSSQNSMTQSGDSSSSSSSSSTSAAAAAGTMPPAAARLVEICTACEGQLRALMAAVQGGEGISCEEEFEQVGDVACFLLTGKEGPGVMHHMGLYGPEAYARELRQYYSLASTMLRTGLGGQPCWREETAGTCCYTAGMAAVRLLHAVLVAGEAAPIEQDAQVAAAAQQPAAVDYSPSLVIFGRCCLFWAQQLQQQAPELLLLASEVLQEEQRREVLLHAHSAAGVCIPGVQQGAATEPGSSNLESMLAVVGEWVADPVSTAAHTQLAAVGCGIEQLLQQQQLEALLVAQEEVQQQGLTQASLAALVQQLQATGVMLSSIAVPHFCNHAACTNISGPTEAGLVSGRSCLCGGCRVARYCGRRCQRLAWAQHKPVCKALQATAAAGAQS